MSFCRKVGDKVFPGSFLWWQHEAGLSPNLIKGSDPLHGDLWKWPCSTVMKDEESVHCFTQIDDGDSVREPLTTKHAQPISLYICWRRVFFLISLALWFFFWFYHAVRHSANHSINLIWLLRASLSTAKWLYLPRCVTARFDGVCFQGSDASHQHDKWQQCPGNNKYDRLASHSLLVYEGGSMVVGGNGKDYFSRGNESTSYQSNSTCGWVLGAVLQREGV